ncbi:hypothetical protein ACPUVO_03265 [Pseudocolwellia sp. HL-MZ19]|uniref:hypothetical protein n=1 Tax=Pseudocolwellia sp. HL-MZ19 TaxID=3400846 RepID=UPI003CFB0BA3
MRRMSLILFFILFQSCATAPPIDQLSIKQIADLTQVTNTEFDSHIEIVGVDVGNTVTRGLTLDVEKFYIRSNINKRNKLALHQLYFEVKYSANDWRFYDGANLKCGEIKSIFKISQEVLSCSGNMFTSCDYKEIIGIDLSYSELVLAAEQSFSVRLKIDILIYLVMLIYPLITFKVI